MTTTADPVEALRQATREAREAVKDLRVEHQALRETQKSIEQTRTAVRDMIAEWEQSISDRVQKAVSSTVNRELAVLMRETTDAAKEAKTRIFERFERIGSEILEVLGGEDAIKSLQGSLSRLKRSELVTVPTVTVIPLALRNRAKQERIKQAFDVP